MDSSLRSRLRDGSARAVRQDWPGLIAESRHPAAGSRPGEGRRPVPVADATPARDSAALRDQGLAPSGRALDAVAAAGGAFDVATNAEVDLVRSLGIPMDRCIHTHPIKKPADIEHAYRPVSARSSSTIPSRHRSSPACPPTSGCWCGWRSATRRQIGSVHQIRRSNRPTPNCWSKHVLCGGSSVPRGSASMSAARVDRSSRTAPRCARPSTSPRTCSDTLGVPTGDHRHRRRIPGRLPRGDARHRGDRRRGHRRAGRRPTRSRCWPSRDGSCPAGSMTLLTSVVGSAVRGGQVWHYLDDGLYGTYSNIMTEDVHPPILAMKELRDGARHPTSNRSRWPGRPATVSTSSPVTIRCRRCGSGTSWSAR